jgi:hypothetical protein
MLVTVLTPSKGTDFMTILCWLTILSMHCLWVKMNWLVILGKFKEKNP